MAVTRAILLRWSSHLPALALKKAKQFTFACGKCSHDIGLSKFAQVNTLSTARNGRVFPAELMCWGLVTRSRSRIYGVRNLNCHSAVRASRSGTVLGLQALLILQGALTKPAWCSARTASQRRRIVKRSSLSDWWQTFARPTLSSSVTTDPPLSRRENSRRATSEGLNVGPQSFMAPPVGNLGRRAAKANCKSYISLFFQANRVSAVSLSGEIVL